MIRPIAAVLGATLLCMLGGCMFAAIHGARYAYGEHARQGRAVDAELLRFQGVVATMAREPLTRMLDPNVQWTRAGSAALVGADAVAALLLPPGGTVAEYRLSATSTRLVANGALHRGTYHETRISPSGEIADRRGGFELRWARQPDGSWLVSSWRDAPALDELLPPALERDG